MNFLVDGYNVLFHEMWPEQEGTLEERRDRLIHVLARYKERQRIKNMSLIFDGQVGSVVETRTEYRSGLQIQYAICSGKADGKIEFLSRQLNNVVVVTADRDLCRKVKKYKAKIISPSIFIPKLYEQPKAPTTRPTIATPKTADEIDEWLELFDLDAEIEIPPLRDAKSLPSSPKSKKVNKSSTPKNKNMRQSKPSEVIEDDNISTEEWLKFMGFTDSDEVEF